MSMWYDRQGNLMPFRTPEEMRAVEARLSDPKYKRVAEFTLPDGRWVSTVWLGISYNFGGGRPLIFETMVFVSQENLDDLYCEKYATEAEAQAGHERVVELLLLGTGEGERKFTREAPFVSGDRRMRLGEGEGHG